MTPYDNAKFYGYNSVEEYYEAQKRDSEIFLKGLEKQKPLAELKPCPFCGGEAKIEKHICAIYVTCTICHAQSAASTAMLEKCALDIVVEAWNRRTENV